MNNIKKLLKIKWTKNISNDPFIGLNYFNGLDILGKHQRVLILGESCYTEGDAETKPDESELAERATFKGIDFEDALKTKFYTNFQIDETGEFICDEDLMGFSEAIMHMNLDSSVAGKRKAHPEKWGKQDFRGSNPFKTFFNIFESVKLAGNFETFWNSVAFYNYIQFFLTNAGVRPEEWQWEFSEEPFFEVLNALRPDIIIAWGGDLYDKTPASSAKYGISGESAILKSEEAASGKDYPYHLYSFKNHKTKLMWIYHPSSPHFYKSGYDWAKLIEKIISI